MNTCDKGSEKMPGNDNPGAEMPVVWPLNAASTQNIRVLVADDEPLIRDTVSMILAKTGFTVCGKASSGRQTLALLERLKPDVLVIDLEMPEMNGLEVCRQVMRENPLPVVMLTAHEDRAFFEQAGTAGVGAYLIKPQGIEALERSILIAMARFEDLKQLQRVNRELTRALAEIENLSDLIPICSHCKKIRDDDGYWQRVESYIAKHMKVRLSHGLCPECLQEHYSEYMEPLGDEETDPPEQEV